MLDIVGLMFRRIIYSMLCQSYFTITAGDPMDKICCGVVTCSDVFIYLHIYKAI